MFHLGLTSSLLSHNSNNNKEEKQQQQSIHETLINHFKIESEKFLSDFTLIISTGLGVIDKTFLDIKEIQERIVNTLSTKSSLELLKQMKSFYEDEEEVASEEEENHNEENQQEQEREFTNVWAKYYHKYTSSSSSPSKQFPVCNFNSLQFEVIQEGGVIYVTKLDTITSQSPSHSHDINYPTINLRSNLNKIENENEIFSSSSPSSSSPSRTIKSIDLTHSSTSFEEMKVCYATLLASLALNRDIIDIRIRSNHQVFNNKARSIVQSNSITTLSYPYSNAGLTGAGEVVGVADTGVDELSCKF